MIKILRFAVAILFAFGAHVLLLRIHPGVGGAINLWCVLLVLFARRSSLAGAAVFGGILGWIQDALAGSLYGLYGIAGTLAAVLLARLSRQIRLQQIGLLAAMFAVVVAFQEVVVAALLRMLLSDPPAPDPLWVVLSACLTGVVGALVVAVLRRSTASWSRYRRLRRPKVRFEGRRA